ncbi:hypothetical protein ACHAW5_008837 [Stephanodiscus triporus]|uniref:GPI mannosyltransferase 1 n=1 Tax=Stephanodiscus triporus TaxID=2934178 RepID=A0ABD3MIV7_9STRA
MSPYGRHTYRYTPFLASLLSFSHHRWAFPDMMLSSSRYFGRVLFCLADVFCGYIVVRLRRHQRRLRRGGGENDEVRTAPSFSSPDLIHALWWMYNPLPINICTRGSAESLVVLLPVLASVAFALGGCDIDDDAERTTTTTTTTTMTTTGKEEDEDGKSSSYPILARACLSGIFHGIGMHAKIYPVIYTVSFMAYFSRQGERTMMPTRTTKATTTTTFPWRHPTRIARLAIAWVRRLFFTPCSIAFLLVSMGTAGTLTYLAVRNYGREALDEGLLYHLRRVDHRHNYSMYWYWIYLARGRAESTSSAAPVWSRLAGLVPLVPQVLILGFSSLGIAPYDLTFALFCQTFAFVAFNKVITAQYFVWYLCLLPLCSSRVIWHTRRMHVSLAVLIFTIVTWLLSAFTLEMLGWRSHRMVWMASLLFFVANVNLLLSIMDGYVGPSSRRWGVDDRAAKKKKVKAS